jgi:hypothetical protein
MRWRTIPLCWEAAARSRVLYLVSPSCQNCSVGTMSCRHPQSLHCWWSSSPLPFVIWHAHDLLVCSMRSVVCLLHLLSLYHYTGYQQACVCSHAHCTAPLGLRVATLSFLDRYILGSKLRYHIFGTNNDQSYFCSLQLVRNLPRVRVSYFPQ